MSGGLGLTPSQTVGPFFDLGLPWPDGLHAVAEGTPGAFWLRGRIVDGEGAPVPDALIETWQTSPGHRSFARCPTDADGQFAVLIVKPAATPGPSGSTQAPHVAMSVFARGLLDRLVTRVYFADEPDANAADAVLAAVPEVRRSTVIAEPTDGGYRLDIRLQGEGETVFFAI